METQLPKPAAVVRIPLTVPADQASAWPKRVEAVCARLGVRVKVAAEPGRASTMFIFELRGSPEALREAQGQLQAIMEAVTLAPAPMRRNRRVVIAAISFAVGLVAVLLVFGAAA